MEDHQISGASAGIEEADVIADLQTIRLARRQEPVASLYEDRQLVSGSRALGGSARDQTSVSLGREEAHPDHGERQAGGEGEPGKRKAQAGRGSERQRVRGF